MCVGACSTLPACLAWHRASHSRYACVQGLPVRISDTAGIRATADVVEAEGVVRARQRGREAQLKLCLFDAGGFPGDDDSAMAEVNTETLLVLNKVDLPNAVSDGAFRTAPSLRFCDTAHPSCRRRRRGSAQRRGWAGRAMPGPRVAHLLP